MLTHSIFRQVFWTLPLLVILVNPALARILDRSWTYQEMFDKAELVVIATASETKDTGERTTLKVRVKGVETKFTTALTLKGPTGVRVFILHHYQVESEDDPLSDQEIPLLVSIPPGQRRTFLLFLIKEKDGRYAPATGQTDPAVFSVLKLNGAANPAGMVH
jgi:hypothetical protein